MKNDLNVITDGIREGSTEELKMRVALHKARFTRLFYNRYKELLPTLISYENNDTGIDFLKVEVALRNGYDIAIGQIDNEEFVVLGFVTSKNTSEDPANLFNDKPLTKEDINFIIPKNTIPEEMREITNLDNCTTGNFVVLRNKTLNYVNDFEVIKHYTAELSELVLSRYSISMQAKINTFFISEPNNETANQVATELYNGSPFIKTTKLFDPRDNIYTIENEFLASNFQELKREYQNKISELNNMLGINSLAVEKSSGVSDTEAKSNRSYTTSNANIYLSPRNNPLEKFNKRFNKNIIAIYNDEVASEFSKIAYSMPANE